MKSFLVFVFLSGQSLAMMLPPYDYQRPPPLCGCRPDLPVCGSDYRTYSSECDMNCGNKALTIIFRGRCEDIYNNVNNQYPLYPIYNYDPYNPYYRQSYPQWPVQGPIPVQDPWSSRGAPPNSWRLPEGPTPISSTPANPWLLPGQAADTWPVPLPPGPWPLNPMPDSWPKPQGPIPNSWNALGSAAPSPFGAESPSPSGWRSDGPKVES